SVLLLDGGTLRKRGRSFLALTAFAIAATLVWVAYEYLDRYLDAWTVAIGGVLAFGFLGVAVVLLTEAHEWAESGWVSSRRRAFEPVPKEAATHLPKVSVHVPAYNEPPEMLNATLDALARLDYPDFEVLVIDNNTRDEAVWRPVEAHCAALGPRFRFFHVAPLAGFKAGALNFALERTDPRAEVIAVIDSDYQVTPGWLRDLVPHFAQPGLAIMQAPQDYRDADESTFKSMCHAEYRGFFQIGMITRNERNAIIQHGTMTMVRTTVLREVGGWAEWCITEDAELGLRIFAAGHAAGYIPQSYGRGLMPDTFNDFRKQRFRWAYGAVQILRHHARRLLLPGQDRLTAGQRYHFLAGWLPWLADGLNLFYTAGALAWSLAIIALPKTVDPPLAIFCLPPLALFGFKLAKMLHLYLARMRAGAWPTLGAALAGLALSHTVAKAMLTGFVTRGLPFFRTPKCENRPALVQALAHAAEEGALALALWLAALGVLLRQGTALQETVLWSTVLLLQSLPYLAAVAMSLISARPRRPPATPNASADALNGTSGAR
ncbi:MAG TPA: glycosyltransferase, partial [Gammaproteobacteria bacterium]